MWRNFLYWQTSNAKKNIIIHHCLSRFISHMNYPLSFTWASTFKYNQPTQTLRRNWKIKNAPESVHNHLYDRWYGLTYSQRIVCYLCCSDDTRLRLLHTTRTNDGTVIISNILFIWIITTIIIMSDNDYIINNLFCMHMHIITTINMYIFNILHELHEHFFSLIIFLGFLNSFEIYTKNIWIHLSFPYSNDSDSEKTTEYGHKYAFRKSYEKGSTDETGCIWSETMFWSIGTKHHTWRFYEVVESVSPIRRITMSYANLSLNALSYIFITGITFHAIHT